MRALILTASFHAALAGAAIAETPKRFFPEALQQDGRITLSPGFSPDGRTIYFAQSECSPIWECPQTLKRSTLGDKGWSAPAAVDLGAEARADWPAVSPDGSTLIFSWSATRPDLATLDIAENFDLYTLDLTTDGAMPRPIDTGDINRPRAGGLKTLRYMHNEAYPSLTRSGALYFMTERPDGVGERDIYVARMRADGSYGTATPVAGPINSPQRDDGVWVNADETIMLLTYNARGGEGGADLFVSFRGDGQWSEPVNLGAPVNSPAEEFGARLTPDGKTIIFTSDRPDDGNEDRILQVYAAPIDIDTYRPGK